MSYTDRVCCANDASTSSEGCYIAPEPTQDPTSAPVVAGSVTLYPTSAPVVAGSATLSGISAADLDLNIAVLQDAIARVAVWACLSINREPLLVNSAHSWSAYVMLCMLCYVMLCYAFLRWARRRVRRVQRICGFGCAFAGLTDPAAADTSLRPTRRAGEGARNRLF